MKKKNSLLKWMMITVVILIVVAIVGNKSGCIGGAEKKKVVVEKCIRRTIIETVSASGKIQPEVEVKISPDVSGEIVELNVKEGDRVRKGQLMIRILPDIYQSYVDRAVAAVNSAKANLENSRSRLIQAQSEFEKLKLNFNRNKTLFEEKLISAADWEAIKSSNEVAQAEVEAAKQNVSAAEFGVKSAQASQKEAQDNLRKTSIFAPVDGTISKLNVEKGERVVGTSQMAGTEMLVLANLNEMEVNVDVNENDIVRVHPGDTATIEVDAYLGKKFKGVVTEVANSANVTGVTVDQVTNFTVKVRILRDSYTDIIDSKFPERSVFNPGMSATVDIRTKQAVNVLSVPIQAVTTRDTANAETGSQEDKQEMKDVDKVVVKNDADQKMEDEATESECVFTVSGENVKLIPVKTGIQDNNYIEIQNGLTENDEVVAAPYNLISRTLKNGDAIERVNKDELYSGGK